MSRYHGGKQRLGSTIATVITRKIDGKIKGYCEPFLGMANVMEQVIQRTSNRPDIKYLAGDTNGAVISMWNAVNKDIIKRLPRSCSPERYKKLHSKSGRISRPRSRRQMGGLKRYPKSKNGRLKEQAIKGFLGHSCSFGGIYMKGFLGSYIKDDDPRRIPRTSRRKNTNISIAKQALRVEQMSKVIRKAKLKTGSYEQFSHLKNYVIYCDPPYVEYNEYYDADRHRQKFDTEKFWNWAEKMSENNIVIVSGYSTPFPNKWDVLWSTQTKSGHMGSNRARKEKLFIMSQ